MPGSRRWASRVKTSRHLVGITGVSTPDKLCGEHFGNKEEVVRIHRWEEIHRSIHIVSSSKYRQSEVANMLDSLRENVYSKEVTRLNERSTAMLWVV